MKIKDILSLKFSLWQCKTNKQNKKKKDNNKDVLRESNLRRIELSNDNVQKLNIWKHCCNEL